PCTSAAQVMSPRTVPSTCRSADASTSPRITTSAPITEKVALLATGRLGILAASDFFENMGSGLQKGPRIDRAAVNSHFEVEVRAGRTAGAADLADHVTGANLLANARLRCRHVRVTRHQTVTVGDLNHFAVALPGSREGDATFGGGVNGRANRAAKVQAGVHGRAAVERVAAITEARRDHAHIRRHDLRDAVQPAFKRAHASKAKRESFE